VLGKPKGYFAHKQPEPIIQESEGITAWISQGEGEDAALRYLARYVFRIMRIKESHPGLIPIWWKGACSAQVM
jgi:hypothetical protein